MLLDRLSWRQVARRDLSVESGYTWPCGPRPSPPTGCGVGLAPRSLCDAAPFWRYNERMSMQVGAVYERGMLKPLQPLHLAENEHVSLLVTSTTRTSGAYQPDVEFTESLRTTVQDAGPAPGLDEVRRRLSKRSGTLTADFIAEREDR